MTRAILAFALLTAVAACGDDDPPAPLSITWGAPEGAPSCVYDEATKTVEATLKVEFAGSDSETAEVTVTAYADENTSEAVGSGSRTIRGGRDAPSTFRLSFPVSAPPHQGEDDVIACGIEVD